jgi:hypothetical protein
MSKKIKEVLYCTHKDDFGLGNMFVGGEKM